MKMLNKRFRNGLVIFLRIYGIIMLLAIPAQLIYAVEPEIAPLVPVTILGLLFLLAAQLLTKKTTPLDTLNNFARFANEAVSCESCKQKLVITRPPAAADTPPHMIMRWRGSNYAYYCPHCKKYCIPDREYQPYTTKSEPLPIESGMQYTFSHTFIRRMALRSLLYAALMAVIFLWYCYSSGFQTMIVFFCIAGLSYFLFLSFRNRSTLRGSRWELLSGGLAVTNPAAHSKCYYPWDCFLLVTHDEKDGWIFATTNGNFALGPSIEGFHELTQSILDQLPKEIVVR